MISAGTVLPYIDSTQDFVYDYFLSKGTGKQHTTNFFTQKERPLSGCVSRLGVIPALAIDITLQAIKHPLQAIECLALAIINAVGTLLGASEFSFSNAGIYLKETAHYVAKSIVGAGMFAIFIAFSPIILPLKLYQAESAYSIRHAFLDREVF